MLQAWGAPEDELGMGMSQGLIPQKGRVKYSLLWMYRAAASHFQVGGATFCDPEIWEHPGDMMHYIRSHYCSIMIQTFSSW